MEKFRQLFNGVEDPRTGNATRHDFHEMLMIAVFSRLFRMIKPEPFAKALSRFSSEWARMLEAAGVTTVLKLPKSAEVNFPVSAYWR